MGPTAPAEMTSVAPSRMMWQNVKKKKKKEVGGRGGGGGRNRSLGKVMSREKVVPRFPPLSPLSHPRRALRALRPRIPTPDRGAALRGRLHKAEGVSRLGGVLPRDPSAGLSRFRSLRCSRFRHCGSPGPWSLRPRPELFRLPASFLRPRRVSC